MPFLLRLARRLFQTCELELHNLLLLLDGLEQAMSIAAPVIIFRGTPSTTPIEGLKAKTSLKLWLQMILVLLQPAEVLLSELTVRVRMTILLLLIVVLLRR